ncbi:MAG: hypothetical protein DI597_05375 [Pseudoxanthomonas spadix]|nr:MAG: hypothetical protein DI597_05375 [Pseudoxanthomonas spadix]
MSISSLTPEEQEEVPATLLRLEELRLLSLRRWAIDRAMTDRQRELQQLIKQEDAEIRRIDDETPFDLYPSTGASFAENASKQVAAAKRRRKALSALLEMVNRKVEECERDGVDGDRGAFHAAKDHLSHTLKSWGLSS